MQRIKEIRGENMDKYDIELLDSDYWDSEQDRFVITLGQDWSIPQKAKIKDHDGVIWDCYLVGVEYFPETDQYEVYYQEY